MSFRVLLTCAGGEMSSQIIRQLQTSQRHADIEVLAVDADERATGRHFANAFAMVPRADTAPEKFVDVIVDLCDRWKPDLVWPGADAEAIELSEHRERIEREGAQLMCGPAAALRTFGSKARTYEALDRLGIEVPLWREVRSLEDLADAVRDIIAERGEAVAKPASARGGRGVCVVSRDVTGVEHYQGGRELHMGLDNFFGAHLEDFRNDLPAIVMERLVEPVYDLDMLGMNGEPVRVGPRRRVVSSMPNEGHTVVDEPSLIALGEKIIRGFDLTWLYDCDVMMDRSGRPKVLEVNPRPSGSAAFMVEAGLPLFDDIVSIAKGEPLPEVRLPVGRVVIPYTGLGTSRQEA